jgi:hypothetical protein
MTKGYRNMLKAAVALSASLLLPSLAFGDTQIASTSGTALASPFGVERAPAITAAGWTCGAGWDCSVTGTLNKNADGVGTAAPATALTISAGVMYQVVITVGAVTVGDGATYTLGGTAGTEALDAAGTYTHYITATNTNSLIITPTPTATRFTVTAVSVKVMENAINATYSSGTGGISATDTNTNTTFKDTHSGGSSLAFRARVVLIRNRGANPIHYDLGDGVATSADTRLESGASISMNSAELGDPEGWEAIGIICTTGLTATVDVDAW